MPPIFSGNSNVHSADTRSKDILTDHMAALTWAQCWCASSPVHHTASPYYYAVSWLVCFSLRPLTAKGWVRSEAKSTWDMWRPKRQWDRLLSAKAYFGFRPPLTRSIISRRSQWPRGLRRGFAVAHFLDCGSESHRGQGYPVSCEYCVLCK